MTRPFPLLRCSMHHFRFSWLCAFRTTVDLFESWGGGGGKYLGLKCLIVQQSCMVNVQGEKLLEHSLYVPIPSQSPGLQNLYAIDFDLSYSCPRKLEHDLI